MLLSWGDIFVSGLPLPFLFLSMFLMSQLIPEQRFHCYWVEVAVGLPKSTWCPVRLVAYSRAEGPSQDKAVTPPPYK